MQRTLKFRGISLHICSLLAVFFIMFSFVGCGPTDENFVDEAFKPKPQPGDSIPSFEKMRFEHGDLKLADHSASAKHTLNGDLVIKDGKSGEQINFFPIFDVQMATTINWAKSTGEGAVYLSQTTGEEKKLSTRVDQLITLTKYEKTSTLKFIGKEKSWTVSYEVPSYKGIETYCCIFDSAAVVKQITDTIKNEVIEKEGKKVHRIITTSTVRNFFTDRPAKEIHTEDLLMLDTTYVAADIKPGEKIYQGSTIIEGSQKYFKLPNGNYHSEMKIKSYYIQDGVTSTEEELIAGEAKITFALETNPTFEVPNIAIGNPNMISGFQDAAAIAKGEEREMVLRSYSFPFIWQNGFSKKGSATVERLYFVRSECRLAMPTSESSIIFVEYVSGEPTLVSNYNFYNEGKMYFKGIHNSTDKTDLEKGQIFKVKAEDKKTDFTVEYKIDEENVSWVIFTETWSTSGQKIVKYSLGLKNTFGVSDRQRVYGESLSFLSGPVKASDNKNFEQKGDIYARTVTTVQTMKYDLCDVLATDTHNEGYIMYDAKRYDFKTKTADVTYKSINTPTATEVEENLVKLSRKSYEVTFSSSIHGDKIAYVNVDKVLPNTPTLPEEWGPIDWEKTKQWGGLSWFWQPSPDGKKPIETMGGSIITTKGIILLAEGGFTFTQMDVNTITARISGIFSNRGGNKWAPSYVNVVEQGAGKFFWRYEGLDGSDLEINGGDITMIDGVKKDKPFFETPSDTPASTYKFSNGRLVITYKGVVLFDETSLTMANSLTRGFFNTK